jgi:hypothetical protein
MLAKPHTCKAEADKIRDLAMKSNKSANPG